MSSEIIPIKIENQHELLNRLADGYGTLSRTLMEYIDNSFDSANEYFDNKLQKYTKEILIEVEINRHTNIISISDNCVGMNRDDLERLANKINNSNKVEDNKCGPWVNGRFGLGAQAFRIFSERLTITSRQEQGAENKIVIDRNSPDAKITNKSIPTIKASGTRVELSNVEKQQMKGLIVNELKNDIEKHFERLLTRNVKVIVKEGSNEVVCDAFDYDKIEGISFKRIIDSWGTARDSKRIVPPERAIEVNIKVCKQAIDDRPVYFSSRGRKINNVKELASFMRATRQGTAWTHPLIIGYIEVKDILQPMIHRNEFKPQKGIRTAVYSEIIKQLETDIEKAIKEEMQNTTNEGMKNLGDALTDMLSKLAKEDNLALRKIEETGNKPQIGGMPDNFTPNDDGKSTFTIKGGGDGSDLSSESPARTHEVNGDSDPEGESIGILAQAKRKGMQIELTSLDSEERAGYSDGIIYIYTNHPDFKERAQYTKKGGTNHAQLKITERLANYLAAIISSKYKDQFYAQKRLQPERDKVLKEQIDFIFKFENMMQSLIGQPISQIADIKR